MKHDLRAFAVDDKPMIAYMLSEVRLSERRFHEDGIGSPSSLGISQ